MDKIKRSLHITDWNVYNKLDELIEGYNELMERLDKRDEGIHKMVKRIKHDLYGKEKLNEPN